MPINVKKKGNAGENKWANWLRGHGIIAYRNSSSGAGINKSDVHNSISANFEVKTAKHVNLKKSWKQSVRDADKSHTTPYLVIHLDGMVQDQWLIVMNNYDWLDQFKKAQEPKTPAVLTENRESRYKIERVIQSAKEVLKMYEQ